MWSNRSRIEAKAARAFRLKRYAEARTHLEALLEFVGENPNTLHVLGLCAERTGEVESAQGYAQRALACDPVHFEALRLASRLAISKARDDEARGYVKRALEALPTPPLRLRDVLRPSLRRQRRVRPADYDRELREWLEWAATFAAEPAERQD